MEYDARPKPIVMRVWLVPVC